MTNLSPEQAFAALEAFRPYGYGAGNVGQAIDTLRAAFAAPVSVGDGEAVAWTSPEILARMKENPQGAYTMWPQQPSRNSLALYTHPSDPDATERMRAALEGLTKACLASDFNEHWDEYIEARAALGEA